MQRRVDLQLEGIKLASLTSNDMVFLFDVEYAMVSQGRLRFSLQLQMFTRKETQLYRNPSGEPAKDHVRVKIIMSPENEELRTAADVYSEMQRLMFVETEDDDIVLPFNGAVLKIDYA
ncbi:hypothetical protein EYZ11_007368 [Aspergillus tanneri]|nr:hypothetical protein EYZ11_007368 [Aspergillus tanneri]